MENTTTTSCNSSNVNNVNNVNNNKLANFAKLGVALIFAVASGRLGRDAFKGLNGNGNAA